MCDVMKIYGLSGPAQLLRDHRSRRQKHMIIKGGSNMKDKEFEKAGRLWECADVSFEEARDALRTCGGDMLEAMVYLERLGHAKKDVPIREVPSFEKKRGKERVFFS